MAKRRAVSEPEGLRAMYERPDVREFFKLQGARGGAIGGKKRAAGQTAGERSALARKAAQARWRKKTKK